MIRLDVTVADITQVIDAGYTVARVYTDTAEDGSFTTLDGTITLVAGQTGYSYVDTDGTTSTWYKVAYYGASPGESNKSSAQQGGTADAYCTAFDVRQELAIGQGNVTISQKHEQVVWQMCLEASRLIDAYKQVEDGAYLASGSEVRYFDGTGDRELWLDDNPAVSLSTVEVEETDGTWTAWASDDYFTYPYNAAARGRPITRVIASQRTVSSKSAWRLGVRRVRLTGVWGISSSVPDLVARAAKIQVAQWYKRAAAGWSSSQGDGSFGTLRYPKALGADVMALLDRVAPLPSIMA